MSDNDEMKTKTWGATDMSLMSMDEAANLVSLSPATTTVNLVIFIFIFNLILWLLVGGNDAIIQKTCCELRQLSQVVYNNNIFYSTTFNAIHIV